MPVAQLARTPAGLCKFAVAVWLAITSQFTLVLADDLLSQAEEFEAHGNYRSAVVSYQRYLSSSPPKSAETRLARIKLPVLQETVRYGLDTEIVPFLAALEARAIGFTDDALTLLRKLIQDYPGGHLVDDAIFMSAYILMMDQYNFAAAGDTLQSLIDDFPDSPYIDTSMYSLAIVSEQMGDVNTAGEALNSLRDRHGSLSIAGIAWPKDDYLSRFWFNRADKRLEHLQQHIDKASQLISFEPGSGDGFQYQAVVRADGREYSLLLNDSQLVSGITIVTDTGATLESAQPNTYEGKVFGVEDSWARVSIENGSLRGLINIYDEQIRLHPYRTGGSLADFHPLLLGDNDGNRSEQQDHVLYPPQVTSGLNVSNFGNTVQSVAAQDMPTDNVRRIMASDTTSSTGNVNLVARVGVVVDSKFNNYFAGRGVDEALSILNASDGIFRQQLGLALSVAKVILIEEPEDDPMNLGSVTMETMMRNFREYRMGSDDLAQDIGLATLFTGNKNSDSALGLAWIGSACRNDGFDVSVVSPYYLADLLSTHEIGHTLGAPHDTDTACASQNKNIMWPFLSGNTQQQFSSCSKDSVNTLLAASTGCHINAIDLAVDITETTDTKAQISVTNLDHSRAASGVQVAIESSVAANTPPAGCSASGQTGLNCSVNSLGPQQTTSFQVDLTHPLTNAEILAAEVNLTSAMDVVPYNNAVELDALGNTTQTIASGNALSSGNINNFNTANSYSNQGMKAGSMTQLDYTAIALIFLLLRRRRHQQ